MEQERINLLKIKLKNLYEFADKFNSYFSNDEYTDNSGLCSELRQILASMESIMKRLGMPAPESNPQVKQAEQEFEQQLLAMQVVNKCLSAQESFAQVMEMLERGECSGSNVAASWINDCVGGKLCEGAKALTAIQNQDTQEQLKAMAQGVIALGQSIDAERAGVDVALTPNDYEAEFTRGIEEIVETKNAQLQAISCGAEKPKELQAEELESLDLALNQLEECLQEASRGDADGEQLTSARQKLGFLAADVEAASASAYASEQHNSSLDIAKIQALQAATDQLFKYGMATSMQRLAAVTARTRTLQSVSKEAKTAACDSGIKCMAHIYGQHPYDEETYGVVNDCVNRIMSQSSNQTDDESE